VRIGKGKWKRKKADKRMEWTDGSPKKGLVAPLTLRDDLTFVVVWPLMTTVA
jgi:hypothetical protein